MQCPCLLIKLKSSTSIKQTQFRSSMCLYVVQARWKYELIFIWYKLQKKYLFLVSIYDYSCNNVSISLFVGFPENVCQKKISERVLHNCSTYFIWLYVHVLSSTLIGVPYHLNTFFYPQRSGHNYHCILFVHIPDYLPNLYN